MSIKSLILAAALGFTVGCIEPPPEPNMANRSNEQRSDDNDDHNTDMSLDLREAPTVDMNSGRDDVDVVPVEPRPENPFPDGRDSPPPEIPDGGTDSPDPTTDENGRPLDAG